MGIDIIIRGISRRIDHNRFFLIEPRDPLFHCIRDRNKSVDAAGLGAGTLGLRPGVGYYVWIP